MVEVLLSTTKQENRQNTSLLQIDSLLLLLQPHSSSSSSSPLHKVCCKVLLKLKQFVNSGKVIPTSQRSSSIEEMLKLLLGVPCCYPPYFFQAKRTTTIQLSISPYPKPGEPCLVSISTTVFVLKISGVVSTSKKRGKPFLLYFLPLHVPSLLFTTHLSRSHQQQQPTQSISNSLPKRKYSRFSLFSTTNEETSTSSTTARTNPGCDFSLQELLQYSVHSRSSLCSFWVVDNTHSGFFG
jgi:hypothetical protein